MHDLFFWREKLGKKKNHKHGSEIPRAGDMVRGEPLAEEGRTAEAEEESGGGGAGTVGDLSRMRS